MEQLWNSGSLLAAACGPAVHFWVAADGRTTLPEPVVRATAHGSSVRSLAWTGNNRVLCCAGDAPGVDVHSSEGIICNLGAGRSGGITSLRCTASKYLVVGNQDGTLQLMQLATQSLVGASKAHRSKVVTLATNRSGGLVASADSTGRVRTKRG